MHAGTCKHFNSSHHNTHCDAGVCYANVTPNIEEPGSYYREPCHRVFPNMERAREVQLEHGAQGVCDKYEEPTAEELSELEAYMQKRSEMLMQSLPWIAKIKAEHQNESAGGIDACPCCNSKIRWSIAACNGHVHARCETEDCLNFME